MAEVAIMEVVIVTKELLLNKFLLNPEFNIFLSKKNILSMNAFKELKEFLLKDKLLNMKKEQSMIEYQFKELLRIIMLSKLKFNISPNKSKKLL